MISARIRIIRNSLHVRKWHSVPERASCGTEYARGAQNRLLWYAAHFQGHSVRRTGFSGTGVIFGTGNPLLWYGADIRCAEQPSVVRDAFSGAPGTQQPPPAPSGALKIGLLLVQKADSGVWRQELLCGPEDS